MLFGRRGNSQDQRLSAPVEEEPPKRLRISKIPKIKVPQPEIIEEEKTVVEPQQIEIQKPIELPKLQEPKKLETPQKPQQPSQWQLPPEICVGKPVKPKKKAVVKKRKVKKVTSNYSKVNKCIYISRRRE